MDKETIVISNEALPYLVIQRGMLSSLRGDPKAWREAYADMLRSEMRHLEPWIPDKCVSILDVGSGLGGIDIMLNEHYGGGCHVTLLDGIGDPPVVEERGKSFSNARVAASFMLANGVRSYDFIDSATATPASVPQTYDLIVSLKAWCFHIAPERYFELVCAAIKPGKTRLIVDIRLNSATYAHALPLLLTRFRYVDVSFRGIKMNTHVLQAL